MIKRLFVVTINRKDNSRVHQILNDLYNIRSLMTYIHVFLFYLFHCLNSLFVYTSFIAEVDAKLKWKHGNMNRKEVNFLLLWSYLLINVRFYTSFRNKNNNFILFIFIIFFQLRCLKTGPPPPKYYSFVLLLFSIYIISWFSIF